MAGKVEVNFVSRVGDANLHTCVIANKACALNGMIKPSQHEAVENIRACKVNGWLAENKFNFIGFRINHCVFELIGACSPANLICGACGDAGGN